MTHNIIETCSAVVLTGYPDTVRWARTMSGVFTARLFLQEVTNECRSLEFFFMNGYTQFETQGLYLVDLA